MSGGSMQIFSRFKFIPQHRVFMETLRLIRLRDDELDDAFDDF